MRSLNSQEREALWLGLQVRKNLIQTGSTHLSAEDIQNMQRHRIDTKKEYGAEIKALSTDQMKLVILSEELINKVITGKVLIED